MASTTTSTVQRDSTRSRAIRTTTRTGVRILGDDSVYVCAVVENRVREVGLAILNITSPTLLLATFSDSHQYDHTITKLSLYHPSKIVIARTVVGNSDLHSLLHSTFPDTEIVPVARKYFNETKGSLYVKQLAIKGSIVPSDSTMYLALAACAAIIKYNEFAQNITFASGALKIEVTGCTGTIIMDCASIINLELISNAKTNDSKHCLYGVLNNTKTIVGARLLRINLCQPPNDKATIETRLNCVEELVEKERMFFNITGVLPRLSNLDGLLSHLVQLRKEIPTIGSAKKDITSIIYLKQTLATIPLLYNALDGCSNALFVALRENLACPSIIQMQVDIDSVINQDTTISKSVQQMRMQQCFAIKPGIHGLLDVARKAYSETIEDIHQLFESEKMDLSEPKLRLQFTAKRGYYYSVLMNGKNPPPKGAIQIARQGKSWTFSTESLSALNTRQNESLNEIMLLTARVLDELLHSLRQNLATLYSINDTIAMLDLLTSFAAYVSLNDPCVRPQFTVDGALVIKEGRHPILDKLSSTSSTSFIPNDTYISDSCNFQIITGPNMSGKSTYIRQVALLVILAHIGCYVPAQFCSIRTTDRIFTRIGTADSIENNASSFMVEMSEMAYILQNFTDKSLIIVDELGRATSTSDGRAIAWSIAEQLLSKRAFTLFTTHCIELVQLEELYANVLNHHLIVDTHDEKLVFQYQLTQGKCTIASYGIKLAALAGFPISILQEAERLRQTLENLKSEMSQKKTPTN